MEELIAQIMQVLAGQGGQGAQQIHGNGQGSNPLLMLLQGAGQKTEVGKETQANTTSTATNNINAPANGDEEPDMLTKFLMTLHTLAAATNPVGSEGNRIGLAGVEGLQRNAQAKILQSQERDKNNRANQVLEFLRTMKYGSSSENQQKTVTPEIKK